MPNTQRSLVIFPGALGDFLCFLPALRTLSQDSAIDLLANSEFADLVPSTVRVDSIERYEIRRLFVPGSAEEERLQQFFAAYSSIFSWMGSAQGAFVRELLKLAEGRARVFPFQPPAEVRLHQSEYYLTCANRPPAAGKTEIPLRSDAVAWSERYWRQHFVNGKPVVAIAPGSGAREKNWPHHSFRAVAQWWRRETSGAVVVILGPVEEERGDYTAWGQEAVVARNLDLGKLAALLARSDLYLGNDSGVSHLAAALGVPAVVLFGPSDVARWAPRGDNVTVMTQNVECAPCSVPMMKNCSHRKCLTTLVADQLVQKLACFWGKPHLDKGGGRDYSKFRNFISKTCENSYLPAGKDCAVASVK